VDDPGLSSNGAEDEGVDVNCFRKVLVVAGLLGLMGGDALAEKKPLEERHFFRPVRIGLCGGVSPDCLAGAKFEFAGKYLGTNISFGLIVVSASTKVYPAGAFHSEKVTWRPYAFFGASGGLGLPLFGGGGVGTDVHLFKSKRLLLQPSVSVHKVTTASSRHPEAPTSDKISAGGSLSVMAAF